MKKLAAALCIVGTAFALSACETGTTTDSGASYANERTAGDVEAQAPARSERVFRASQSK